VVTSNAGQPIRPADNLDSQDALSSGEKRTVKLQPTSFTHASGDRPLEGYTIKRGVGIGGFGEVYFAISDGGKEVALKRIQRNMDVELRGVRQCLNLKHHHLVDLFDIHRDSQDRVWVVMEFIAGDSLKQLLDRKPDGLAANEALAWMHGIAGGVSHLHRHGIVHRDLKPANVFHDNGVVNVGDYGLSKFISSSHQGGQTESVGTFHYMAPEIGKGEYGKPIDVYALGIIFYELLTGRVPFNGESSQEIIMKHLTDNPDLSEIDARFRFVIAKALEKDPARRFLDAGELLQALPETDYDAIDYFSEPPRNVPLSPAPERPAASPEEQQPAEPAVKSKWRRRRLIPARWQGLARNELSSVEGQNRTSVLLQSFLKSAFMTFILTCVLLPLGGMPLAGQPDSLILLAWLVTINITACWLILLMGRCWETAEGDTMYRRVISFIGGVGLGTLAYGAAQFLNLSPSSLHQLDGYAARPWFDAGKLTLAQSAISYGALFAIFRWWKQVDPLRWSRVSVIDTVACGFVAWMLPIVPLPWGYMSVVGISLAIQMSSPWMSREDRQQYKVKARYH
jgi:serine/threonine protein kinase